MSMSDRNFSYFFEIVLSTPVIYDITVLFMFLFFQPSGKGSVFIQFFPLNFTEWLDGKVKSTSCFLSVYWNHVWASGLDLGNPFSSEYLVKFSSHFPELPALGGVWLKRNAACLNSESSFFKSSFRTTDKEPSLLFYLPIAGMIE